MMSEHKYRVRRVWHELRVWSDGHYSFSIDIENKGTVEWIDGAGLPDWYSAPKYIRAEIGIALATAIRAGKLTPYEHDQQGCKRYAPDLRYFDQDHLWFIASIEDPDRFCLVCNTGLIYKACWNCGGNGHYAVDDETDQALVAENKCDICNGLGKFWECRDGHIYSIEAKGDPSVAP